MKTAFYAGGTIILVLFAWAAIAGFPTEISALMCIIVPAVITGTIGFIWGRHGRPRLRVDFPDAPQQPSVCTAYGHPHGDDVCECGCFPESACAACGHLHRDDVCNKCDCAAFMEVS